ncbi:hypothetical protein CF335_g1308 [Tilletia laevis]|nr:hypothetical protein CF335_g1308 [Tilletia laevis]
MNPREDLVREALGDATLLIPYILGEDLASLPAEFTSAPVLERKRWLGNPSAADSAAGSSLTSQLYAPAGSSQDDLDSKTEAALHDFRLFAERAVFPARHEANSSSSSGGTRSQRIVSPLLTQRPRFRRPQPDVLLSAVPLPLDEDAAATGQKTGRNALTLLLLYEPNHQPSTPTFTFLNLLPFPLQSLPGVWNEDVQAPTASQGHSPSDNAPAQEYHNDGDDFWSGVDSDSSSTRSKDAPQHVEEADEDERYWAQYNDVQETGDGDNEQVSWTPSHRQQDHYQSQMMADSKYIDQPNGKENGEIASTASAEPRNSEAEKISALDEEGLKHAYGQTGLAGLIEDRLVLGMAALAALGGLLFGYDQGVISVTLVMQQFTGRFPRIDPAQDNAAGFWKGLLTAMIELGAILGAASAGYIADRYSRRNAIRTGVAWFTVGSALQTGAVGYGMLVVGRLIGGVGIGMLSMTAPLYMSEISPPNVRGMLLGLEELMIVFGICVAYGITYGTRYMRGTEWAWRFPFLLQIVPGLLLAAGVTLLPYSPRWLASRGRDKECLDVLIRLRRRPADDAAVQAEFLEIRSEALLQRERKQERHPTLIDGKGSSNFLLELHGWADTLKPGCRRRTIVGVGLMFFQQFVGINALIYYSPQIFEQLGLSYNSRLTMGWVANLCQLLGVILSFPLVDRVGRKPLLAFGSIGMTICLLIVAILTAKFSSDWASHRGEGWTAVAFVFCYMVIFGMSWGPVPWTMPAEIFPSSLRAKGVALSTVSNWFNNFIIGLITPPLIQSTGYGAFVFFAVFSFLSLFFTIFVVPETRGVTLEQMDNLFGDSTGKLDEARIRQIELDLARRAPVYQD